MTPSTMAPSRAGLRAAAGAALATAVVLAAAAMPGAGGTSASGASLEVAGFEDYVESAGRMVDGELHVELEARAALWRPWGDDGAVVYTHVFAVAGAAARMPAPLIRVAAGTPVRVTVRNTFDEPLYVRGFRDHALLPAVLTPGQPPLDSVRVAPHGTVELRFTPNLPGTYVYGGRVQGVVPAPDPLPGTGQAARGLLGVLLVDPPGTAPTPGERVFLITHWADADLPASWLPATRFFINGRSWPHTERLVHAQGDTARWRVINFTGRPHPMHLHGFYFHVDARGNLLREQVYTPAERRMVVTEVLSPGETMRMSWLAEEPGNWVFHCHFMRHMSGLQHADPGKDHVNGHGHGPGGDGAADELALMGGLVLGISVLRDPSVATSPEVVRRRIPLFIGKRDSVFDGEAAYGFVVQEEVEAPAADSVRFPGSLLELVRGEATEIVVYNRADVALGVHWHGLELESRADGVPGWSGEPGSIVPAIPPGDSLAVRITPRRAGTFMYHVHSEPGHQLAAGLYGALLVTEPDAPHDAAHDHLFLLGSLGTGDDPPPAINGQRRPAPLELRAGTTHRLRFMHISPDDVKRVTLLAGDGNGDGSIVAWEWVAKDGADLPASQRGTLAAASNIAVGETYDYLWAPAPGDYTLRVVTTFDTGAPAFPRPAPPPDTTDMRIRVR